MFLSIIIPVYNAAKTIEKCVNSIILQSKDDFEVLLIDDGSTDNSSFVCEKICEQDKRVRLIKQNNRGVSSARNLGLKYARGEYVSFVDSDDWVSENYIFIIKQKIETSNADIIFWGMNIGDVDKVYSTKKLYDYVGKVNAKVVYDLWENNLFGMVCNKAIKKSILKKNNIVFNEKLKIREDQDFMVRCWSYIRDVAVLNESLYYYYQNSDSVMHTFNDNIKEEHQYKKYLDYLVDNCELICAFMLENNVSSSKIDAYCKFYYYNSVMDVVLTLFSLEEKEEKLLKIRVFKLSKLCEKYIHYNSKSDKFSLVHLMVDCVVRERNDFMFLNISRIYCLVKKIKRIGK